MVWVCVWGGGGRGQCSSAGAVRVSGGEGGTREQGGSWQQGRGGGEQDGTSGRAGGRQAGSAASTEQPQGAHVAVEGGREGLEPARQPGGGWVGGWVGGGGVEGGRPSHRAPPPPPPPPPPRTHARTCTPRRPTHPCTFSPKTPRSQEGLARGVERVFHHVLHKHCCIDVLQRVAQRPRAGVGGQHKLRCVCVWEGGRGVGWGGGGREGGRPCLLQLRSRPP